MAQMLQYCHAELLGHQIEKPHKSVKWIITHTDGLKSLAFTMKQLFLILLPFFYKKIQQHFLHAVSVMCFILNEMLAKYYLSPSSTLLLKIFKRGHDLSP